jgi:hypothetical protein
MPEPGMIYASQLSVRAGESVLRSYPRRILRDACVVLALCTFGGPLAAVAQTLDAPDQVCLRDRSIVVEWTGPNGNGDLITIAFPQADADVYFDGHRTSDGSPATLDIPFTPGTYEIRYVQNAPLGVTARREIIVEQCGLQQSSNQVCPLPTYPPESFAVVVSGVQSDSDMQFPPDSTFTLQQLCDAGSALAPMLGNLMNRVQTPLGVPAGAIRSSVSNQLQNMRNELCPVQDDSGQEYFFTITYAHCRMAMETAQNSMDIHLPPGGGDGQMSMADHATQEVVQLTLGRSVEAASQFTGAGWSDAIQMTQTGSGTRLGFPTTEYRFESEGGLGVPGLSAVAGPQALGNLVTVKNEGTASLANCVPGVDIVQDFYQNLSREIHPDQTSFFAGLINNIVGMLDRGIPLEMQQSTSSAIAGRTMVSGTSHSIVTGIEVIPMPPEWCSASLMPAGYAVTDIDQQISDVMSGAPAGNGGEPQPGLADATRALNDAMQQLTPEQREAVQGLGAGFGQLLGGLSGQGSATAQPQGNAAPAVAAGAAARPSSASLMTDDLNQTAQKMLQALGYDPGNTDGDVSIQTTIAISQFQAEQGLEVTGAVTPQLVGILAAEVDR